LRTISATLLFPFFPAQVLIVIAFSASTTTERRAACSASGVRVGLPVGCRTLIPVTMRGDPIVAATCVMEQICTVGMPARSISFAIAAPQRVLVPQVEVSTTA